MGRYDDYFPPYVPVAERREQAAKAAAKLAKKLGRTLRPVEIEGTAIAKSYWGKAWCTHVGEEYAAESNRLPRGRSYVRSGAVIDLQLQPGLIKALVKGSRTKPYDVEIEVEPLSDLQKKSIRSLCTVQPLSALDVLQGKMPRHLLGLFCNRQNGIFPRRSQVRFSCSCPDDSSLCKHLAAVLYGVGHRLDEQPELLFALRGLDIGELVTDAAAATLAAPAESELGEADLSAVFGIELAPAELLPVPSPAAAPAVPEPAAQHTAKKKTAPKRKTGNKVSEKAKEKTPQEMMDYICRYTGWGKKELAKELCVSVITLQQYRHPLGSVPAHRQERIKELYEQVREIVRNVKQQRKK